MTDELKNTEPQDIEDVLEKIERSFDIKFKVAELAYATTFGQICDHIEKKIQLQNADDNTTQQAFYKLRGAISLSRHLDINKITPQTALEEILPRRRRIANVKQIEKQLGFGISILRPPHWVTGILTVTTLLSIIGLFFNWQIGLSGFVLSVLGFWLFKFIGKEFSLQTVGQVSEKMVLENYLKSRRNSKTFNKSEIEKVVTELFIQELGIDKSALTKDAKLV